MKLPTSPSSDGSTKPRSLWDKVITSTPVVMTVLATVLAGLSSSEGNQAQYFRALASQNQSKASDQWNFFQSKKMSARMAAYALELHENLGDVGPLVPEAFSAAAIHFVKRLEAVASKEPTAAKSLEHARKLHDQITNLLVSKDVAKALATINAPLPPAVEAPIKDAKVRAAYESVKKNQPESVDAKSWGEVDLKGLREALTASEEYADASDAALKADVSGLTKLQKALDDLAGAAAAVRRAAATSQPADDSLAVAATDRDAPGEVRQLAGDFKAAIYRFDIARYDRDAKLNQQTAYLYEVAVQRASWFSERSRTRSRYFFYGMLGAQAAVTIATMSLAVREKSWLWMIAASIGVVALCYAAFIYVTV